MADTFHDGDKEYVCVVSSAGDGCDSSVRLWSVDNGDVRPLAQSHLNTDVRSALICLTVSKFDCFVGYHLWMLCLWNNTNNYL